MPRRKVRAGTVGSKDKSSKGYGGSQDRCHHRWYFCAKCRKRVRRQHQHPNTPGWSLRGQGCDGPVFEMDGYVQIPRAKASDRQWRLWMQRFCQPFRELKPSFTNKVKINGVVIRQLRSGNLYRVKVKGGPMDGLEALAMNTTVVYVEGHAYRLNSEGDFVYDSGQAESGTGSGKHVIPKSPV